MAWLKRVVGPGEEGWRRWEGCVLPFVLWVQGVGRRVFRWRVSV